MSFLSGFEKFVRQAEPLAMHTWFQLGGPAEYFAEPLGVDDLVAVLRRARQEDLPVHVLGRGSNILVRDEGVRGVVMTLSAPAFRQIEIAGDAITAGGGARLGRVVTTAAYAGLAGLEELVAIPGTVGGALHGNAGTPAPKSVNGPPGRPSSPTPARSSSANARTWSSATARATSTNR